MPRQAYFLDPDNAKRCSRCYVRPAPRLKPTQAELAEATQSFQAKLMQELSADHYGSLSPKPIRWRHSKRSPHSENKAFFTLKQLVATIGLVLNHDIGVLRATSPDPSHCAILVDVARQTRNDRYRSRQGQRS